MRMRARQKSLPDLSRMFFISRSRFPAVFLGPSVVCICLCACFAYGVQETSWLDLCRLPQYIEMFVSDEGVRTMGRNFLFAGPSLWEGIGRDIDLFGVLDEHNTTLPPEETDALARQEDIRMLKTDMNNAMHEVYDGVACKGKRKD